MRTKAILSFIAATAMSGSLFAAGTVAGAYAGRCSFGGSDWHGVNKGAQHAIAEVTHNQKVVQFVTKKSTKFTCNGSASFYSNTDYIEVRKCRLQGAQPSSYGLRFIHEHCHSVGQSGLYDQFKSAGLNCSGVSPYAGSKFNEMFAEACTAFLIAPERLGKCNDANRVKQFFKSKAFHGPIKSCAGSIANGPAGDFSPVSHHDTSDLFDSTPMPGSAPMSYPASATPNIAQAPRYEAENREEKEKELCNYRPELCKDDEKEPEFEEEEEEKQAGVEEDNGKATPARNIGSIEGFTDAHPAANGPGAAYAQPSYAMSELGINQNSSITERRGLASNPTDKQIDEFWAEFLENGAGKGPGL